MERDIETCQAERKNNKIKKEIMSLLNSFGLSGALEKMSWDRELYSHLECIPLKYLREHVDAINIHDDYSIQGDKITLQVIEELKTRHCQRGVDKNKEEEIRKRYDEATEKRSKDTRAWADEIAYG